MHMPQPFEISNSRAVLVHSMDSKEELPPFPPLPDSVLAASNTPRRRKTGKSAANVDDDQATQDSQELFGPELPPGDVEEDDGDDDAGSATCPNRPLPPPPPKKKNSATEQKPTHYSVPLILESWGSV